MIVKVNLIMVGKQKSRPDSAYEKCQEMIAKLKSQSPEIELRDNIHRRLGTFYFFLYKKKQ